LVARRFHSCYLLLNTVRKTYYFQVVGTKLNLYILGTKYLVYNYYFVVVLFVAHGTQQGNSSCHYGRTIEQASFVGRRRLSRPICFAVVSYLIELVKGYVPGANERNQHLVPMSTMHCAPHQPHVFTV
jgi:hypothetical protein